MGVAIDGYSRVRPGDSGMKVHAYVSEDFPDHADGLTTGEYVYDRHADGPNISYSSYSEFRRRLCRAIHGVEPEDVWNNERYRNAPLYDLIHFSDCEGTIGPITSARIHADLVANRDRFIAEYRSDSDAPIHTLGGWWLSIYDRLIAAFSVASDGGVVTYH